MTVRCETKDGKMTAAIGGEIDHCAAGPIRDEIDEMIRRTRPAELIIDMADVQFMDSSGVGLIMGRYKLMKSLGGRVSVINARQHIYKILILSGIQKIADVKESGGTGKSKAG